MRPIITPAELKIKLETNETVVIDVRSNLKNPDAGDEAYVKGHIPGAHYLHLEKDLSGTVEKHGGNHPLPNIDELANKFGEMGIDHGTNVVIYDADNDMFAARAWWLLHYMGHEKAFLLDGGFRAWEEAGYDLTIEIPARKAKKFVPQLRPEVIANINDVKQRGEKSVLIDSRAKDRYLGKTEPLYQKAGHIPGAQNFFWKDVLTDSGDWKKPEALKEHFAKLKDADEIIVSCGSGVSACPNFIALKMAGFHHVKLYPGSYSDWISYEDNPIETKEE